MKRKTGIICDCIAGEDPAVTVERIKNAGFDTTFTGVYDPQKVSKIQDRCVKIGLTLEFIHAPYYGINDFWRSGLDYYPCYCDVVQCIDLCARHGIPAIILHVSSGWNTPQVSDIGFSRFDSLVEYATKKGVTIAFENLKRIGNLAVMVDRYESADAVRFCYDCGHEFCNTPEVCIPDLFGKRMAYTHIHDNMGRVTFRGESNDFHLLPFDGRIDYQKVVDRLDEGGYEGSLMLEVFNSSTHAKTDLFDFSVYTKMTADEFLQECYRRVQKINALSKG